MKSKIALRSKLLTVSLASLIGLQFAITPLSAPRLYSWDSTGTLGYYDAVSRSINAARPPESETGGTIWTTILQEVAANYTGVLKLNIPICLLLQKTGTLSDVGEDEIGAVHIAVTQADKILNEGSFAVNFSDAFQYDSGDNPFSAKAGFVFLTGPPDNCQVVIGPTNTHESFLIPAEANASHVPVIGPSSTAVGFGFDKSGDYFFRTPGNDLTQAPAAATWIYNRGIRYLGIIAGTEPYDAYGTGLSKAITASFTALGGHVSSNTTLFYDESGTANQTFATDLLNNQISTILRSHPNASQVGVLMIGFFGVQTIFSEAVGDSNLAKVDWFGTDAIVDDPAFLPPSDGGTGTLSIAQFMASVHITGTKPTEPALGPGGAKIANLAYNGTTVPRVGGGTFDLTHTGFYPTYSRAPETYWDYAYDAAVLAMLAILKANAYNGTIISTELGRTGSYCICNITIGATGLDSLSPTGDRAIQNYLYYAYRGPIISSQPPPWNILVLLSVALLGGIAVVVVVIRRKRAGILSLNR